MNNNKIIILSAIHNDYKSFFILYKLIKEKLSDYIVKFLIIDDKSDEIPINEIKINEDIILIKNFKNVGHQKSLVRGLNYIKLKYFKEIDYICIMDMDGEDSENDIIKLILASKKYGISVARRIKRKEERLFIFLYSIYKIFFYILTFKKINFGNFMVIKINCLDKIINLPNIHYHIAGSLIANKFKLNRVNIEKSTRMFGRSKMGYWRLILHGFKSFYVNLGNISKTLFYYLCIFLFLDFFIDKYFLNIIIYFLAITSFISLFLSLSKNE